jgi:Bacterial virulence factor lipase N-terminal
MKRHSINLCLCLCFCLPLVAGCPGDVTQPPVLPPSVIALFDPTAATPVVPQPTDLAFQGGDGIHLNVPKPAGVSPAEAELIDYLNSLDGFPGTLDASTTFGGAIDPATVTVQSPTKAGAIVIVDRDANVVYPGGARLSADGKALTITPSRRWQPGKHYAIGVFGGAAHDRLRGAMGETVLSSQTFFFLRSTKPLVARCGDGTTNECLCPPAILRAADPKDTTCHMTVTGLPDLPTAEQAELLRLSLAPAINQIMALGGSGKSRSDLAIAFTFTIAKAPLVAFDPARSDVPFPNDILIDQTTHLVTLPIPNGDPMASIKAQLNQLDGFSTTAAETVSIDTMDGMQPMPATVAAGAQLFNITMSTIAEQPTATAAPILVQAGAQYAGQIAVQPAGALIPDQNRYAVLVTTDITDTDGRAVIPSPPMVLLKSDHPLFDGTHTTVSLLDDATAAQLEVLRQAYQPLWAFLGTIGVTRDKVAQVWTFTTQSIGRPLNALVAYPTQAAISTNVTISHVADAAAITAAAITDYPTSHLDAVVFGSFQSHDVIDHTKSHIDFTRTVSDPTDPSTDTFEVDAAAAPTTNIKFVLTLPAGAANGLIVMQHGLTEWRGQTIVIADAFAAAGWATLAFDANFHGARAFCTDNTQCVTACDTATGVCSGGLQPMPLSMDPQACTLAPLDPGDLDNCRPLISGLGFVNTADFFLSRDNQRQYVTDLAQAVRVINDAANLNGLQAQLPAGHSYGAGRAVLGQSLGAMLSTLYLAAAPAPRVAYLSVPGGHEFEAFATGSFKSVVDMYLQQIGVMPDTPAFVQLVNNARWILDPADPFAVGRFLRRAPMQSYLTSTINPTKFVVQQSAGMDTVILPPFQSALAREIFGPMGLDASGHPQSANSSGAFVSTFWPTALHGSLFSKTPPSDGHITTDMQNNAVQFVTTNGATITAPDQN